MLSPEGCYIERVVVHFVFGLAFLCGHSMAALNETDDIIVYSISEERPAGTVVGNLALDARLYPAVDVTQTTFSIISTTPNATDFFTIEQSGILKTQAVIDRDVVCAQQSVCEILFSVIVQSKDYFRVFKVLVKIDDINDCDPIFSPSQLNLTVPESSAIGELIPLPTAMDLDSPVNGVASYALQPDQDPFRLQVHNVSGLLDVRLNLTSMLNREQQSSYSLTLVAFDGGLPPRSGYLVLEITVADVNDNIPVFDESTYTVSVPENTSVGSVIIVVHATDRDDGPNGRVQYRFSQRSQSLYGRTFFLEPDSGKVILLQMLNVAERSSYNLAILAVDQGSVPLSASAALQIVVTQVNDRPPIINVDVLSDDELSKIPETSPTGTFVAHISVSTQGGQTVSCSLNDTDNFQLVPLTVRNEFKVVTARIFNAAERNNYEVVVSCAEDGEPYLSSARTLSVFITPGTTLSPPIFSNSTYGATVIVSAPRNTVVTTVHAQTPPRVTRNVTIVYAIETTDANKSFDVDPQTGVVKTLVSFGRELVGTILEFYVIASYKETNGTTGPSSRARVRVSIVDNGGKPPRFQQNYYSFSVLETADVGTAIGSVMATIQTADSISYDAVFPQGTTSPVLAVDESSGLISTTQALVRDFNPRYEFLVVARNRRFVDLNDTATVDVYVQENRPNITYPGPGYNNTVYIPSATGLQTLVATATARLPQLDLAVCFSIRNYSESFSVDIRSGEIRVNSNISQFSNHTLALVIEAMVCGHPFARSFAILYVTVVGDTGLAPQSLPAGAGGFDSRAVILACVLAVCLVLAAVMVVAIVLVCRRSRKRSSNRASGDALFWTTVPMQARTSPERSFSRDLDGHNRTQLTDITRVQPPDAYKAMDLEEVDADSGCPSNSSSSQTSSDDGAGAGGGSGGTSRAGGTGGGVGGDPKGSSNSSDNNDSGNSASSPVFVTTSSSHLYSSVVPNWLKSSSAALPLNAHAEATVHSPEGTTNLPDKPPFVLKPSLSRSGSLASRKSIRFGPDGSAIAEAKKKVTFAEQNQYLELNTADVTASDVTDLNDISDSPRSAGEDEQDDVSDASSYADSETRRTVINTLANSGYANVPHYPPPGVTFGTFLPEDGSLV